MSTLKERLKELTTGMKRGWQVRLASHCGIKPPSVSDWATGKTLQLEGENLLRAADFFQCSPRWLATGKGSKYEADTNHLVVMEERAAYGVKKAGAWPFKNITPAQWSLLDDQEHHHIEEGALLLIRNKAGPPKRDEPANMAAQSA
jgi:hypothetical protein